MTSLDFPVVLMGTTATGKSTIGEVLAKKYGERFIDGDDLHSDADIQKMASGHPLTDADRWPWLDRVGDVLAEADSPIVACSALRKVYRDRLRQHAPTVVFVHLQGSRALLEQRMRARKHHFMPVSLLDSQLKTLEPLTADELGFAVDVAQGSEQVADEIERHFSEMQPGV